MHVLRNKINIFVFLILSFTAFTSYADDLIMMRIKQTFPETMVNLQSAIKKTGYKISRVQRVDIGLTKSGFKTDKYRVVFYGKPNEVDQLSENHPDIIPFLPLKISIFAENNETIILTTNPLQLKKFFKEIPGSTFNRWHKDVNTIFDLTNIIE